MYKRHKFGVTLMIILAALVTSQCGPPATTAAPAATQAPAAQATEAPAQPTEEPAPESGGTIHFLAYPWFALSEEALAGFTAETGITVEQEVLAYEELNTKVATSSAAGSAPADVFSTYIAPLAGHVRAGFAEPLDNCLPQDLQDDLLGLNIFTFDGHIMGVPTYYDVTVMHVNTEMLEQAGAEIPETLDDLVSVSHAIQESGGAAYPLIDPLAAQPGTASRWQLLSLVFGNSPLFDENFQPTFTGTDSGAYEGLKFMVDTLGDVVDPAMVEIDNTMQYDVFLAGDGAFVFSNAGGLSRAEDPEQSTVVGKVATALVPGAGSIRSAALDFYLDGFAASKFSENKEAACQFIQWWLSADTARTVYNELGTTPTRRSLLNGFIEDGTILGGDVLLEEAEYGLPVFAAGIPPWFEEWETDAANQVNQAARGNLTIEEALQNIADKAIELQQE